MKSIKKFHLISILIGACIIFLINPLNLLINQNIVFSTMLLTVALWATSAVHKSIASAVLLITTFIFGNTEPISVLSFVWSETNLLILTTTLLSVGIMKTGTIQRYVEYLLKKCSSNIFMLLLLPYVLGVIMIFLIPQAFARVIILGTIFDGLLTASNDEQSNAKKVLIFNSFIAVTMTYMFFSSGDIVLNQSAIKFAGEEVSTVLTFANWFKLMSVPTLITCVITLLLTKFIFKKELRGFDRSMISNTVLNSNEVSKSKQHISLITMCIIIAGWMTQSIHGIAPWIFALIGVIILFAIKVLDKRDYKSINIHFILFLMTVFSIGKILGQSGITEIIFGKLQSFIPESNGGMYLIIISLVVMILHTIIGSSVATMSVVLPILVPLSESLGYRAELVTLITYIIVNIHFILPFNHATVMIGTAKDFYPDKYMSRFGIYMTFVTLIILYIYFYWWQMLNVL